MTSLNSHDVLLETVQSARKGNRSSFESLVILMHSKLSYYALGILNDRDRVEDVMQSAWMLAWRDLHALRHPEAFRVWIYKIVRHQALRALKQKQRERFLFPISLDELPDLPQTKDEPFTAEDAAEVHRALAGLGPEHREILTLRFMDELDYESMAEILGVNLGTVRSRLHYAKFALRRRLNMESELKRR